MLSRSIPWLHVERHAIRLALARLEPEVILLASDQHRIGALVTSECHDLDIPTAVLQHGLPQHRVGYVPVVANRVLTWSEGSCEWFVEHGTDRERLMTVGNPAFDVLFQARHATAPNDPPAILLALTPATRETNGAVVATALDALDGLSGTLTVKLHPGDGNWDYVRQQVARHRNTARVRVAHREPLGPILLSSRITWLHRSSVALESLAAGVPVVVIAAASPSTADIELRRLDLPLAETSDELANLSFGLLSESERRAYFEGRPVSEHVGPTDGHAAERARDALFALAAARQTTRPS
jgi:hypothetical protein